MSIEDDIRAAKSPREAVLILARAIDVINARHPAADPWADWGDDTRQFVEAMEDDAAQRTQAIEATRQQLAHATDAQEIQALSAKLRLLQEDGTSVAGLEVGRRAAISETGEVDLPAVDVERRQLRRNWAMAHQLWEYIPLDANTAADSFAAGGPEWLVLGNRDAVMQMPFAARQWMVEDLALDSPQAAQELGRDILKSEDSPDHKITVQAVSND